MVCRKLSRDRVGEGTRRRRGRLEWGNSRMEVHRGRLVAAMEERPVAAMERGRSQVRAARRTGKGMGSSSRREK